VRLEDLDLTRERGRRRWEGRRAGVVGQGRRAWPGWGVGG
jgi:hypothetical protein